LSVMHSLILVYAEFKVSYQPEGVIKAARSQQQTAGVRPHVREFHLY
jgi:hypothetical protein